MTPRRSLVLLVALVVVASVAATAHGLFAVAVSASVPPQVAVLYPLITDGLALVAYAATKQLDRSGYPWLVVVVAAGLSGLAQAVNLAGLGSSPTWLRFGVGFWPAVAVLLAAHLYWLVRRPRVEAVAGSGEVREEESAGGSGPLEPESDPSAPDPLLLTAQAVAADLHKQGLALTRARLIEGIRGRDEQVSTARATELLKRLRDVA